jgi:hypothetical protein
MGPAVMITVGILFLLDQMTHVYWMNFGRTWPALLIVIGLIMFLQHNASSIGHVPREYMPMPPGQAPYTPAPQQWQPPAQPAPQAPPATSAPGTTSEGEVRNA